MDASTATLSSRSSRAGDSFAIGVMVMLMVSVLQRSVGLLRGLGFCHFLSDVELGQWALANSFFMIGVPIAVLGLPGSFGKFSEYYRNRQQFGDYVRRVAIVSCLSLAATCGLIVCYSSNFSWLVFGDAQSLYVVGWCVAALVCVTAFSFVNELVASLRQVRVVSIMQFMQSVTFAIVGLALIAVYHSWTVLLPSFALASLVGMLPGIWAIYKQHAPELVSSQSLKRWSIWQRIVPYAATIWLMNFLSNMFEVSDRYMLLHLTPGGDAVGQSLVGQYHASYILPNLLTSIAVMLSGVLLPYLSADWEADRRDQIADRLRQMLQSICICFIALSVGALSIAPLLYGYGFGGRYLLAEQVLPFALVQATWVSLFFICQTYMMCAERGKILSLLLVVGLFTNLILNWFFIQWFGLYGAIAATSTANLLTLLILLRLINRQGCHLGWSPLGLSFAPLALLGGPALGALLLVGIVWIAGRTNWILSRDDRAAIDAAVLPRLSRLRIKLETLWP
jgi:O-antigen/teichoic acid export membrane protein